METPSVLVILKPFLSWIAVSVVTALPVPAATVVDFSGRIPAMNTPVDAGFASNVPNGPGITGATVTDGKGTPDIALKWSATAPGAWQFYKDPVWTGVGQLDGGGTSNRGKPFMIAFTPSAGIALQLAGFNLQSSEEGSGYEFEWAILRGLDSMPVKSGSTGPFKGPGKIPVKVDFNGEPGQAYTLRLTQTGGNGPGGNIALDDLAFSQSPVSKAAPVLPVVISPVARFSDDPSKLRIMTWNILHGGRDDGKEEGPKRVAEVLRAAKPDIVSMQETYGSGEFLSEQLGFHFHPRGTNVSIHSRYPVVEDISVYKEFCCSGALLELPDKSRIAFYAVWLGYSAEIWEVGTREGKTKEQLLAACKASENDIAGILSGIKKRLEDKKYAGVPVVIAGDFNSMSHSDYTAEAMSQYGFEIEWPTSLAITADGFKDSYRELHPTVDRVKDRTWSPRFPGQQKDRIDYIYYKAGKWEPLSSTVLESHPVKFPSDHSAVITDFQVK